MKKLRFTPSLRLPKSKQIIVIGPGSIMEGQHRRYPKGSVAARNPDIVGPGKLEFAPDGNTLIQGHRRFRALQEAGMIK